VGKAGYNHPNTRATIEALRVKPVFRRICGFVTRASGEFAEIGLGEKVHQVLVDQWVTPELVGHISRDATAIKGREVKPRPEKSAPRKKGRPRRGEVREPKPETRLKRQCRQSAQEALAELPVHCAVGRRRIPRAIRRPGEALNDMPTSVTVACPSAWR
jgi:hypothetical protein